MLQCPALNQRIFRSKTHHPLYSFQNSVTVSRPEKFKQWSEEVMEKAVNAVINNGMSVRRAAMDYDVPKSTLGDRVSGRVIPGSYSGPRKLLSEEEELVVFAIGYPKSRKDLLTLAQRIIETKGIQHQISNGWWGSFCKTS